MNIKSVIIIIAAILIGIGIFSEFSKGGISLKDKIDIFENEPTSKIIDISGESEYETLEIITDMIDSITVKSGGEGIVAIGGARFNTTDDIVIENFSGSVKFGEYIDISGRADIVTVGGTTFDHPKITATDMLRKNVELSDLNVGDFVLYSAIGTVQIDEGIMIDLNGENVTVFDFNGVFKFGDNLVFNGNTTRVEIIGDYSLKIES